MCTFLSPGGVHVTVPDPLPPNVISIHVRHSDKKKEMDLLPLSAYMAYADKLRSIRPEVVSCGPSGVI